MTNWAPHLLEAAGPKYLALADEIEKAIGSGDLCPGEQLPTHRDMAAVIGVTVGTVTRGYAEARGRGLISGTVGRGTFVSPDATLDRSILSSKTVPSIIELGQVSPLYYLDPPMSAGLKQLAQSRHIQRTQHYSEAIGHIEDRRAGAKWLELYGLNVTENAVIVCAGAQHGLTCILTGLLSAGDSIAVEHLTYPGFTSLAGMLGMKLVPVGQDQKGMIPELLEDACKKESIKAIFLMPGQQNPTTGCMNQRRRQEIIRVARIHSLLIIEDCAYDLSANNHFPPLTAMAPERSIMIAGVSKYFGAGLRTAYITASPEYRGKLSQAVLNTTWMASPITARLTGMWINDGTALKALISKKEEARGRNKLAADILSGFEFRGRQDGFFIWLNLPHPWTGPHLEIAARERNVSIFCADKFAVGTDPAPQAVRISLTGPESRDELEMGLVLLRNLIASPPLKTALL